MKIENAIFITETSQVNRGNEYMYATKTLRIKRKVLYNPHMPFSLDVHKPALTGGCSHKCL